MSRVIISLLAVAIGYLLDLLLGDPRFIYHPIRIIGNFILYGERFLRKLPMKEGFHYAAGAFLSIATVLFSFFVPYGILLWCFGQNIWFGFAVETFFCWQILAVKSLKTESMKVYDALAKGNIAEAKLYLSYIVGRDTQPLKETELIKGAVETVAENTSDGVIAPLLYLTIGGAPLGFLYKAVNTLDSMIGYKNAKYIHFGRFAAKLDDVFNFIPARLSAVLMLIAGKLYHFDFKNGMKIFKRDRYNHLSPNSAQTESVCAGLLNIQLAGSAVYDGKTVEKPTIGDKNREVMKEDIKDINKIMVLASFLGVFSFLLIKAVMIYFMSV